MNLVPQSKITQHWLKAAFLAAGTAGCVYGALSRDPEISNLFTTGALGCFMPLMIVLSLGPHDTETAAPALNSAP